MDSIFLALGAVAAATFAFVTALATAVFSATDDRGDPQRQLGRHIRAASVVSGVFMLGTGALYLASYLNQPSLMDPAYRLALFSGLLAGPAYIVLHHTLMGESFYARWLAPRLYGLSVIAGLLLVGTGPYFVIADSGWDLWRGNPLPHFGLGLWIYAVIGGCFTGYMAVQAARIVRFKGRDAFWLLYGAALVVACLAAGADLMRQFKAFPVGVPTLWLGLLLLQISAFALFARQFRLLRDERRTMAEKLERLRRLLIRDGLTGLYTRAYLESVVRHHLARMGRDGRELGVLFLDVDNFKGINDRFGHSQGDVVLRKVGEVLRTTVRGGDLPARWAGDEFVVLLPDTRGVEGRRVAVRILRAIRQTDFGLGEEGGVTVSMGYTVVRPDLEPDWRTILEQVDRAMYHAKSRGKNRVAVSLAGRSRPSIPTSAKRRASGGG